MNRVIASLLFLFWGLKVTAQIMITDLSGNKLGEFSIEGDVKDAAGTILGRIQQSSIIDGSGKKIGSISLGEIRDADGKLIGSIEKDIFKDANGKPLFQVVSAEVKTKNGKPGAAPGNVVEEMENAITVKARSDKPAPKAKPGDTPAATGKGLIIQGRLIKRVVPTPDIKTSSEEIPVARKTQGIGALLYFFFKNQVM